MPILLTLLVIPIQISAVQERKCLGLIDSNPTFCRQVLLHNGTTTIVNVDPRAHYLSLDKNSMSVEDDKEDNYYYDTGVVSALITGIIIAIVRNLIRPNATESRKA